MAFANCFALLLTMAPFLCNALQSDDESFVVALLPEPIYEKASVMLSTSYPTDHDHQNIEVTIKNTGEVTGEIGLETYFSDHAEVTSVTMCIDGVTYIAKKLDHKEAQRLQQLARTGGHVVAIFTPKRLEERFSLEMPASDNSIQINSNKEITFNVEFKKTLHDTKVPNRANVFIDLSDLTAQDIMGEISSPIYTNSPDISWLVRVPSDNIVQLNIVDISISNSCGGLTIYDGISVHLRPIARLSGNMVDQKGLTSFRSTCSSMSLHLLSECSLVGNGFTALTSAIQPTNFSNHVQKSGYTYPVNNGNCSGYDSLYPDFVGGYFYVSSPNYPDSYYNNNDCTWRIYLPNEFDTVSLTVLEMYLEDGYDYLYVYDRDNDLLASLTGGKYPSEPILSQGDMRITFVSDSSITGGGFNLQFEVVTTPSCNETDQLYAYSYYSDIVSLNYPNDYYNNLYCTWSIRSFNPENVAEIYFADYQLDWYDLLVFYDGPTQYYKQIAHDFKSDTYVYSTASEMFVVFVSDSWYSYRGFRLMYKSAPKFPQGLSSYKDRSTNDISYACGNGLFLQVDPDTYSYVFLQISDYMKLFFNSHLSCYWFIETTHPSHGIHIEVNDASIFDYDDSVKIFEGWDATYSSWSVYDNNFAKYFSESSQVKIKFATDFLQNSKGFLFLVKSAPIPLCSQGEILDIYSGYRYLTSPNFPNGYYSSMSCSWTIHSHDGNCIQLDVTDFAVYFGDIYIYTNASDYKSLAAKYFENSYQSPFYATGNEMYITYDSFNYPPSLGFQFRYSAVSSDSNDGSELQTKCTNTHYINDTFGAISYSYDDSFPIKLHECWVFDTNNQQILLTFHYLWALEASDYLGIYDGDRLVEYYPGSTQYYSTQHVLPASKLWLQFVANNPVYSGFTISYSGI